MNLRATHYGYAYQDLITGISLVDLMLGTVGSITVDTKGFPKDRFDDLTIEYRTGRRIRIQIKHTSQDRELTKATFSGDGRSLRLDQLFGALLSDLSQNAGTAYRVVVRDGRPDDDLANVLKPIAPADDPGNPLPGVTTRRYRFDPQALRANQPWKKLVEHLTGEQLQTACVHLTVDTNAPASTLDITSPGPAERALLRRVTEELGAGRTPNTHIAPEHAALVLAHAATAGRTLDGNVTRENLSPRLGLTTDFGAVAEGHPIEPAVAVARAGAAAEVRKHVDAAAPHGGLVIVTGEPGVGKSWLCEQLADTYREADWIVARHHCWLGAADINRDERVLTDVVIGSLLRQLEQIVPEATTDLRPRFAATPDALAAAVRASREAHGERRVLLIVDGLDHVDRVLGRRTNQTADPSRLLVDSLAAIELPPGVCMLIASQPGSHLGNAGPYAGAHVQMPRMSWDEVRALAHKHQLLDTPSPADPLDDDARAIVDLVHDRSGGNALYATYLCRYGTRISPLDLDEATSATAKGIVHRLRLVPDTGADVDAYYAHLLDNMTADQKFAIGTLALCDFALSADELGEILPQVKPFLAPALAALAPVLNSQPGLGGLRIHHESFSRHILRDQPDDWIAAIRGSVSAWLTTRGFFADARAFRHLPELLARLDRYNELKDLIQPGFVAEAIRAFQPPSALQRVVSVVARESEARLDWPTLITCVETRKSIDTYETESLTDAIVEYADVVVSILGADVVAERLLYEGRPTFPAISGLRLCHAIDRAGAAAPWKSYIEARDREADRAPSTYGSDSDGALHLAIQLGTLRLRSQPGDISPDQLGQVAENLEQDHDASLDDLVEVFTAGLPAGFMLDVAAQVADPATAARVYLTLASLAAAGTPGLPDAVELARSAWTRAPGADIIGYLRHGIPPSDVLAGLGIIDLEAALQEATDTVLGGPTVNYGHVQRWLSFLELAHARDRSVPLKFASQLSGIGFYRAWLRYTVATIGIADDVADGVLTPESASTAVRVALHDLAGEAHAFTGSPRACDLYFIHSLIHEVIENTLVVVQPADLDTVLDDLIAIGDGTTTSTMGMFESGPLATNDLLEILSRVSGDTGVNATHALLDVIRERRHDTNTQYRVISAFELATARICLAAGATDEANECWRRACLLLASYGGHKDPTISEITDSIEDLAAVDVDTARECLAQLLDLPYLVRQHTDGRSTSHFVNSWWELAATIDPTAAATDGADTLLTNLGFEDIRVHVAHKHILETQVATADPIVTAALRLTVGATWRDPNTDLTLLARLQNEIGNNPQADVLLTIVANTIAASYDDQPMMYSTAVTKSVASPELIAAITQLGGAAFPIRTPRVEKKPNRYFDPKPEPPDTRERLHREQRPVVPEGRAGAIAAARDYDKKQFRDDADAPRWDVDALANAIGWRVIQATLADGAEVGIQLIDDVAREVSRFTDNEIFAVLGVGLAIRCDDTSMALRTVASYCLTVAYIRIRGGGGWRSFAGRERVDLWERAHDLDPGTAEGTLAAAVAGTVDADAQRTYGITQAVNAAFGAAPTGKPGGTADECWKAAFSVIQHRLPGTAARDGHTYRPTAHPDSDEALNVAMAKLALATIVQPMRADLRQPLVATTLLVTCRPVIGQIALADVLSPGRLDAGRTTWLLEIIRDCLQPGELTDGMAAELTRLAQSDWLAVRAFAGRILDSHGRPVPDPPATPLAPRIPVRFQEAPEGLQVSDHEQVDRAEKLVDLFLDERLTDAGEPPGLREAIIDRVAVRIDDLAERVRAQVDHLRSPSSRRIPDAYFADEEAIENELQISAAGIRTARAIEGALSEPRRFEHTLAQRLGPTGLWALRSETSRVPRPPTRADALEWSLAPIPWLDNEGEWPPAGAVALADIRQLTGTGSDLVRVHEAPYEEWVQVALFERQATFASTHPDIPARRVLIATGLEVCDGAPPAGSMPLSSSPPNLWTQPYNHLAVGLDADRAAQTLQTAQGPLAALIEYDGQRGAPAGDRGAGLQPFALVPRIEVVALLGIRPEAPALRYVMIDDHGPAIICRQWRGFLIHDGSYGQLEPAIHGADLLLRPDLYDIVAAAADQDRITLGVTTRHHEVQPDDEPGEED